MGFRIRNRQLRAALAAVGLSVVFAHASDYRQETPPATAIATASAQDLDLRLPVTTDAGPKGQLALFDNAMLEVREKHYAQDRLELVGPMIASERFRVQMGVVSPYDGVNNILKFLDPRSSFSAPSGAAPEAMGLAALGFSASKEEAGLRIERVFFNSTAWRAGLREGDIVTGVDGQAVGERDAAAINGAVCIGAPLTKTRLSVLREDAAQDHELECDYATRHIVHAQTMDRGIAYIGIGSFEDGISRDVEAALAEFAKDDTVKGYVLDLRNNPGGRVDEARALIDLFVDHDGEIFIELNRRGARGRVYNATPGDLANGKPLVVLINHNSWSAAELTAMALQDQGRARVVGTVSAGKGSMQKSSVVNAVSWAQLGMSGNLRVTTNLYAMPDGNSPQIKGVIPDILVPQDIPASPARREADLPAVLPNPSGSALTLAEATRTETCTPAPAFRISFTFGRDATDASLACAGQTLTRMAGPRSRNHAVVARATLR